MLKKITFLFVITIIILMVGILWPAFQKTRTFIHPSTSVANLKQIGVFLHAYAKDHNDVFPENLEQLEDYTKYPEIFISPRKPEDFNEPSYIYISGHSFKDTLAQKENIIVYENPEYRNDRINALFVDGHVERLEKEKFLSELQRTYEYLGKPMPEIKFKD